MQLRLQNFQSWGAAELDVKGLTVVVGPSNRGKSAFIRALKGALRNAITERRIKYGEKSLEVEVQFDDHNILATRTGGSKGVMAYKVDGQEFSKLGGAIPPPVETMGFGPVKVGEVALDPVFAGQFDSQFLLGSSPAELSAVLNSFSATDKLDKGKKVLITRTNEVNGEAKVLAPIISQAEVDFAEVDTQVTEAGPHVETVKLLVKTVAILRSAIKAVATFDEARKTYMRSQAKLLEVEILAKVLGETVRSYKAAVRTAKLYDLRYQHAEALANLEFIRRMEGNFQVTTKRSRAVDAVRLYMMSWSTHDTAKKAVAGIQDVQTHQQATDIPQRAIRALERLSKGREGHQKASAVLASLEAMQAHLNKALVTWKARVRVKNILALDPETPRALAAHIGNIRDGYTGPDKILKALGIITRWTGIDTETIHTKQAEVASEITELTKIQTNLETQFNKLTQSAVTCPKCSHQFIPT